MRLYRDQHVHGLVLQFERTLKGQFLQLNQITLKAKIGRMGLLVPVQFWYNIKICGFESLDANPR